MGRKANDAEQLDLIEDLVGPEAKKIAAAARKYQRLSNEKADIKEQEDDCKANIIELIKGSDIKPVDGVYRVRVNGIVVVVKPSNDKVTVQSADDAAEGDA